MKYGKHGNMGGAILPVSFVADQMKKNDLYEYHICAERQQSVNHK